MPERNPHRIDAATSAAGVVPFHCIICFDEFNLKERPPVVLPCGHTYVCLQCSKRLTRCMECRTPFYQWSTTNPNPPFPKKPMSNSHSQILLPRRPTSNSMAVKPEYSRQYHHQQQQQQQQQMTPVGVPLPKNLVLLSLMEAAERTKQIANNSKQRKLIATRKSHSYGDDVSDDDSDNDNDDNNTDNDDDDSNDAALLDEDAELNRIIMGIESLSGHCGTYAVKDPDGLVVLPHNPDRTKLQLETKTKTKRDSLLLEIEAHTKLDAKIDTTNVPVRVKVPSTEIETETETETTGTHSHAESQTPYDPVQDCDQQSQLQLPTPQPEQEPFIIQQGQTLQVIDSQECCVKLARGTGYVVASSRQLVKVNGPLDKSCQLEGMLSLVQLRKQEIIKSLQDIEDLEIGLQHQLDKELKNEPSYPIITQPPENHTNTNININTNINTNSNTNINNRNLSTTPTKEVENSTPNTPDSGPLSQQQQYQLLFGDSTTNNAAISPLTPQQQQQQHHIHNGNTNMYNTYSPSSAESNSSDRRVRISEVAQGVEIATPPRERARIFSLSPNSIDNADLCMHRYVEHCPGGNPQLSSNSVSELPLPSGRELSTLETYGCSSLFVPRQFEDDMESETLAGLSIDTSRAAMYRGSSPTPLSTPPSTPTGSFDSIDFRTGMSGHRGVTSSQTSNPRAGPIARGQIRMMSEHRGIGRVRGTSSSKGTGLARREY